MSKQLQSADVSTVEKRWLSLHGKSKKTSNVTGRHRGPKRKLRVGYRAPSPNGRHVPSTFTTTHVIFFIECGIARFLCAMRVFDYRHHPHPLGYLCVKFRFYGDLRCWARHGEKSHTQSLSLTHSHAQLILMPRKLKLSLRKSVNA